MRVKNFIISNFRRLEHAEIDFEATETVFVGANNSGKTSATAIIRCFLGGQDFCIFDYSVGCIPKIDHFGQTGDVDFFPYIDLDIWFDVDPHSIEYGRAAALLPKLSDDFNELGVRLRLGVNDHAKLRADFLAAYPGGNEEGTPHRITSFLATDSFFKRHFNTQYFALAIDESSTVVPTALDKQEGRKLIQGLLRVDFIDAQRNIEDRDTHRSTRLSTAFAAYYQKNLDQAEIAKAAFEIIAANNEQLTTHYADQFAPLLTMISDLGVPAVNDRTLQLVSTLSPETALRGNTDLLYVDNERGHALPEQYNGLGFKNLIYMAIQAKHFYSQWARTPKDRPLCQLIFIEEPEVHLHAQVQQTFIKQIWDVLYSSAKTEGLKDTFPQLIVTTHSSHILDAVDFAKVRYFRRAHLSTDDPEKCRVMNASTVRSLRDFSPTPLGGTDDEDAKGKALDFLKRYLRLTHCDLFFADAAILVEGAVEKLLLPEMISHSAPTLRRSFITILEIGGAYAHRFDELIEFLAIPCLVITDLDSVSHEGHHTACRADADVALTSNATLKAVFAATTIGDLMSLPFAEKCRRNPSRAIVFQMDVSVQEGEKRLSMRPRTFEESFAYQNFARLRSGQLTLGIAIPDNLDDAYQAIYRQINSSSFKKTDFAMRLLAGEPGWDVPAYIAEGLDWLATSVAQADK